MEEGDEHRDKHRLEFTSGISDMWRKRIYTDLVLVVDGKYLRCHRFVLAAISPYFHSRLYNGQRESVAEKLFFNAASVKIMNQVLEFVYTGTCKVKPKNSEDLLKVAALLGIRSLKDKCDAYLTETVGMNNCLKMLKLATEAKATKLELTSRKNILNNFMALYQTKAFKALSSSDIISLIKDNDLRVPNEDVVCDAVLSWANSDPKMRKTALAEIFKHIRLPHVQQHYMRYVLGNNELLKENSECEEIIEEAKSVHEDPGRRHEINLSRLEYRNDARMDDVIVILGGTANCGPAGQLRQSVYGLNMSLRKWFPLEPLPYGFDSGTTACSCGNDIYISGGGDSRQGLTLYESSENTWHVCAPMLVGRRGHAMVGLGSSLFVLGGVIGQTEDGRLRVTPSVEEYKMSSNSWSKSGYLTDAVWGMSCAVHDNKIFSYGGYVDRHHATQTIQIYDPYIQSSCTVGRLPVPCGLTRSVVQDDVVSIICPTGKLLQSDDFKTFEHIATIPNFTRAMFGVAIYEHKLLLFGGKYGSDIFDDIIQMDLEHLSMTTLPEKLVHPVWGFACVKTTLPRKHMVKTKHDKLWDTVKCDPESASRTPTPPILMPTPPPSKESPEVIGHFIRF
ncbi:hypothetical protein SNE40_019268 [Patella caerulea]|uniref:BTB domain-containing protein n=1 Tax=Patella caerulea TaxID=87958 RepID=A0AAN8J6A1_PATCE